MMDTMTFPSPGRTRFVIEFGSGDLHVAASERENAVVDIDVRKGPDPEITHHADSDGTTITSGSFSQGCTRVPQFVR